jgi:hypothetical protein
VFWLGVINKFFFYFFSIYKDITKQPQPMDIQENNHSRKVRRVLNSKFGFVPVLDWNLNHWFPYSEERVQFVIRTKTFHGVVCIDVDPRGENVFIVGYADFDTNGVSTKILVHKDELIDFIDHLRPSSAPHRAPQCTTKPNDATEQVSF